MQIESIRQAAVVGIMHILLLFLLILSSAHISTQQERDRRLQRQGQSKSRCFCIDTVVFQERINSWRFASKGLIALHHISAATA